MNGVVVVNNTNLRIKEHDGQRVVTFRDIDDVHNRVPGTAKRNFYTNKRRMEDGKDYYKISTDEIRTLDADSNYNYPKGGYVITESGYFMLVKSLNDDTAWDVQRQLVNAYFTVQKQIAEQNLPVVSNNDLLNIIQKQDEKIQQTLDLCNSLLQMVLDNRKLSETTEHNKIKTELNKTEQTEEEKKKSTRQYNKNTYLSGYEQWKDNLGNIDNIKIQKAMIKMRDVYGFVYQQAQKEFMAANDRGSHNALELMYWYEQEHKNYKDLFKACLLTHKADMPKYPCKTWKQCEDMIEWIGKKTKNNDPFNRNILNALWHYVKEHDHSINWTMLANRYGTTNKKDIIAKSTLSTKVVPLFNEFVTERYKELI